METLRGDLRKRRRARASSGSRRTPSSGSLRTAAPPRDCRSTSLGRRRSRCLSGSVALAKTLVDYAKDNEAFELRSALVDGEVLDDAGIKHLSTLSPLDELRGKLVGLLQAPAGKLARLLNGRAVSSRVVAAKGAEEAATRRSRTNPGAPQVGQGRTRIESGSTGRGTKKATGDRLPGREVQHSFAPPTRRKKEMADLNEIVDTLSA